MAKKVIVGLSGGVDSAISAYLLKQQGFEVHGVFMHNWHDDENYCTSEIDKAQAQLVSDHLNIPLSVVDFSKDYQNKVFESMLSSLQQGHTPNPDILCNQEIKFKCLIDYKNAQNADFLATGHYANITEQTKQHYLCKATDDNKDQTYFLCRVPKDCLNDIIFPLGLLTKPEVRKLAKEVALPNAERKDSTGICFIGERRFDEFIANYLLNKPGPIHTTEGEIIGEHNGLFYHTIGQRKGLQIGGMHGKDEKPWYVVDKLIDQQVLIVAQGKDHPALFKQQLLATDMHWLVDKPTANFNATCKIRHRQPDQTCQVTLTNNDQLCINFDTPQRAITPGQFIVLYQDNVCMGGAVIQQAL